MNMFKTIDFIVTGGSATYTSAIYTNGYPVSAILSPTSASSTSTLLVQGSFDGTNFYPFASSGSQIATAAGKINVVPEATFKGIPYLRFASTGNEGTNQRTFTLLTYSV